MAQCLDSNTSSLRCKYCNGELFLNYKHRPSFGKCLDCSRVAYYKLPRSGKELGERGGSRESLGRGIVRSAGLSTVDTHRGSMQSLRAWLTVAALTSNAGFYLGLKKASPLDRSSLLSFLCKKAVSLSISLRVSVPTW